MLKIIRDPLYGYIDVTKKEIDILDTWPLQRLRYIKQLALTHYVYPSACHSRFEHSIGVLYIANEMAKKLQLSDEEKQIVRISALLHDIGHGPFSHVFENILSLANNEISHEDVTITIINNTEIRDILNNLGVLERVTSTIKGDEDNILSTIISSELDADKMDYLRRDSYHTGVEYGKFDFHRIINVIRRSIDGNYIVIKEKGIDAVDEFKLAKYFMHKQVYQHHVRIITDAMITKAAELAIEESVLEKNKLDITSRYFVDWFLSMYDDKFTNYILENSKECAHTIIEDILKRRLFKRAYVKSIDELPYSTKRELMQIDRTKLRELEEELANEAGTEPWEVIIYIQRIENPLYRDPDRYLYSKERPLLVEYQKLEIEYEQMSPLTGVPRKRINKLYVLTPKRHIPNVSKASHRIFT